MDFTTFDLEEVGISTVWTLNPNLPEIEDGNHSEVEELSIEVAFNGNKDYRNVVSDEDLTCGDPQAVIPPVVPVGQVDAAALPAPMTSEDLLLAAGGREDPPNEEEAGAPQRKKKKYEQDPKADPTGKTKNAITARLNRMKKKQELELLKKEKEAQMLRAENAEKKLTRQKERNEELQQENDVLTLRIQQLEAQLAGNDHPLDGLYSEICLQMPEYGQDIERQMQQLFTEQQQQ